MMLCRIIFIIAVSVSILLVILLSVFSPLPRKASSKDLSRPWVALSLYIQQPYISSSNVQQPAAWPDSGAFIFHRTLTEGPENTSRVIGKAQGFIIPIENFARSGFNIIHLSFNTPEYSGSLNVQSRHVAQRDREELTVVGGTGSFAFARGLAVFARRDDLPATYYVKLQLRFPNRSQIIPG